MPFCLCALLFGCLVVWLGVCAGAEILWDRLITTGRRGPWTPKEFGLEVVEGEVWGIDPYARRCVELALKEVPRSDRLTETVRVTRVTRGTGVTLMDFGADFELFETF